MNVYLDASFLVSLYSADANSVSAANTMKRSKGVLLVTNFAELEVANAFQLRIFRGEITAQQAEVSWQDFAGDLRAGVASRQTIPEASFARARELSRQTTATLGTRSADLLELGCERLYSFDERQRRLAQSAKLRLNSIP